MRLAQVIARQAPRESHREEKTFVPVPAQTERTFPGDAVGFSSHFPWRSAWARERLPNRIGSWKQGAAPHAHQSGRATGAMAEPGKNQREANVGGNATSSGVACRGESGGA